MEAAKCPLFSPLTPEVPATATTKGEVTFYLFISQLNFYKGIPDSSPRVKQKRLLGVGCTSARRPGLPRIAARPARARPPHYPPAARFLLHPAARPQHLQRGHPLPAAPAAPPAGGASQGHLERGRDVSPAFARRRAARCAAPSERRDRVPAAQPGPSGCQRTALSRRVPALAHGTPWRGAAGGGGGGGASLGAGLSHAHPSVSRVPRPRSPGSGRHSGFICLQADYVSSSLSSWPLGPPPGAFPAPSGSESACVTMVRSRDWPESAVTLQLRTSSPRRYKKCRTELASLRPPELEMQLLGAPEAA